MKDIELAKKYLEEDNLALAVVKNGGINIQEPRKRHKTHVFFWLLMRREY